MDRVAVGRRQRDLLRGDVAAGADLFSTTTECPMFSESFCATMRAAVSVPPPGAKPTVSVTARLGNGCATAQAARPAAVSAAATMKRESHVLPSWQCRLPGAWQSR